MTNSSHAIEPDSAREQRSIVLRRRATAVCRVFAALLPLILVAYCASPAGADDNLPVNLLQLDDAELTRTSYPDSELGAFAALRDARPETSTPLPFASNVPVDLVYGFGGQTVAPNRVVVRLPDHAADRYAGRIEVMASILAPHAGFKSLRDFVVTGEAAEYEVTFAPAAARWVMIRFVAPATSERCSVAEIELYGRPGPPASPYAFKESPADALTVLAQLKGSLRATVSQDEADLFQDARDGKLDSWSFAEAALLASGIRIENDRTKYLSRLDELEQQARQAVAGGTTTFERANLLLEWMHAGPASGGYASQQTDLAVVLDDKTYNCVSSATLYNVLGRRLGLDLRAVEVPDHALSILYDGTRHADVETTTAAGFNPARDPAAQKQFAEMTGFAYIPARHPEQRREVSDVGLVAITYYNHGVLLTKEKKFQAALLSYFCALSLDAEFASAVKNVLAVLTNWSGDLSGGEKYEQALAVVSVGLKLAPEDRTLLHNREAIWGHWAEFAMAAGDSAAALDVLRRADRDVPDGGFLAAQSWVFIRPGEKRIEDGRWDEALTLAATGLREVDEAAREELKQWRRGLLLRWSNAAMAKQDFGQAVDVLARARNIEPEDQRYDHQLGYVAQEWSAAALAREGPAEAEKVLAELLDRFADLDSVKDSARNYVIRLVNGYRDEEDYEKALAAVARRGDWLGTDEAPLTLLRNIYDARARKLKAGGNWQGAVDVYLEALARHAQDDHLRNNAVATWDAWARTLTKSGDWAKAVDIYQKGASRFPEERLFQTNLVYTIQEWTAATLKLDGAEATEALLKRVLAKHSELSGVRDVARHYAQRLVYGLRDEGKFEQALAAVARCKAFIDDEDKGKDLLAGVYDRWARTHISRQEWGAAIAIYRQGLEKLPGNGLLQNNLKYCEQQKKQ